jgi:hypothetical protein
VFKQIDADGDRALSRDEISAYLKQQVGGTTAKVLRIHDILVWIWIRFRGSMPPDSDLDPAIFVIDLPRGQQKTN